MSLKKIAIWITIIAIATKLFGFIKELLLAYFFGTSYVVDSYLLAISLPTIFFGWLTSVSLSYVPIYTKVDARDKISGNKYSSSVINLLILTSIICIIIGNIFANQIIRLVAPGISIASHNLTVKYFKISLLTLLFRPTFELLMSYLNCNGKYIKSNIANLFFSSVQILFVIYSGVFDNESLIYGYLFSTIICFLVIALISNKNGLKYSFNIAIIDEVKNTILLSVPIFFSNAIAQINVMVDKFFASNLSEGSIAILGYGNTIKNFAYSIFTLAANSIIFPLMSKYIIERNYKILQKYLFTILNCMILVLVPITVYSVIFSKDIISFIYYGGKFDQKDVLITSYTFIGYIVGLLPIAVREIIIRIYYSYSDSKTPLILSVLTVFLNMILNYILMKRYGCAGIALATSISSYLTLPIFLVILSKKMKISNMNFCIVTFMKATLSSTAAGIIAYITYDFFEFDLLVSKVHIISVLLILAVIGFIVYYLILLILRVEEVKLFNEKGRKLILKLITKLR